jgi:GTP-binding protein HflX
MKTTQAIPSTERALLVGVAWKRSPRVHGIPAGTPERESLAELVELARSAGAAIAGTLFQLRDKADPATLVGRGKLDEILAEANAKDAPLIIFDSDLSPVQQRNIEGHTARRVIDRTQLILDIFARHARSREGQLQVELAQLNYMLPRLTGRGPRCPPGRQRSRRSRRRKWRGAASVFAGRVKKTGNRSPPDSRQSFENRERY